MASWQDLELWQVGRGLIVRVRAPHFGSWWNAEATWKDDPIGAVHDWIEAEHERTG